MFKRYIILRLCGIMVTLLTAAVFAQAATFPVTNTNETGPGSYNQAIIDANNNPGADIIEFTVAGTLTLTSAPTVISESVLLDGTTAPGYATGAPTFQIDGQNFRTIDVNAFGQTITIRGLDLSRNGNRAGTGINFTNSSDAIIEDCRFEKCNLAISVSGSNNCTITGNAFIDSGNSTNEPMISIASFAGTLMVSGQTFGAGRSGLSLFSMANRTIGDENVAGAEIVIEDNSGFNTMTNGSIITMNNSTNMTIDGIDLTFAGTRPNAGEGIKIAGGSDHTIRNVYIDNRNNGILIQDSPNGSLSQSTISNVRNGLINIGSATMTLRDVNFGCINIHAIDNNSSSTVDAENNYWGAATGPSNLGGAGESYDGMVDADPFLTSPAPAAPDGGANCADLAPACSVTVISVSNADNCDGMGTPAPGDDTFTADVTVTFENAPATGELVLSGDGATSVMVGSLDSPTSHTFIGVSMSADGELYDSAGHRRSGALRRRCGHSTGR